MAPSDEAIAFYHAVYSAVQEIPPGKVTSYGHIASLIGTRETYRDPLPKHRLANEYQPHPHLLCTAQRPRQVGLCLKYLSRQPLPAFHQDNVPWQRVVNAKGGISPRSQPQGVLDQVAALRAEGVEVTRSALGELVVDFGVYGWFPGMLPSEAQEGESVGVGVGEAEAEGVDEGEDVAA
ncbi:hypothetical protein E4U56_002364 [Claviceps arundinis]|uniref:Methylated-DNA-[protein]-cysteine S-methyltransferase DNA binding domain-containing protein n=1 Tax=Claviceps arundinis TaxID=1623583 RepID=A0A9P7MP96_9HYPO|nr:hypothetical protein E4U56_002364 [Claviceps arundinis]